MIWWGGVLVGEYDHRIIKAFRDIETFLSLIVVSGGTDTLYIHIDNLLEA